MICLIFNAFGVLGLSCLQNLQQYMMGFLDLLPVRCLGQKNPNIFLPNGGEFNGDESHGRIH